LLKQNKMPTTAYYRNLAREYEEKLDWKNAHKYYKLAIRKYPKFAVKSELMIADLNYLKKREEQMLKR